MLAGPVRGQRLEHVVQRQAAVDDILDDQDVLALDESSRSLRMRTIPLDWVLAP